MPLYAVRCEAGHEEEVLRSIADRDGPYTCSTCAAPSHRVMASFHSRVVDTGDEHGPTWQQRRNKKEVLDRAGGGRAVLNHETGGYRPAATHHTRCPKGHWANVAILHEFSYGKRLNCDRCGYVWIYYAATAPDPLIPGYDRRLVPGMRFSAFSKIGGERYEYAPRGA